MLSFDDAYGACEQKHEKFFIYYSIIAPKTLKKMHISSLSTAIQNKKDFFQDDVSIRLSVKSNQYHPHTVNLPFEKNLFGELFVSEGIFLLSHIFFRNCRA